MKKLCTNKFFGIFLIIILIIFLLHIFYKKYIDSNINIENFQASTSSNNPWNGDRKDEAKTAEENAANEKLQNTIKNIVQNQLEQIKTTQGAIIKGPPGPPGQQGPAGSTLIASGKLVNKANSFDNSTSTNYFLPQNVLTRTGGTEPKYSVSYMDSNSAFASFQDWQYDINNNIKSRYDGNCLTMDNNKINPVLYLDKCDSTNNFQKWKWDNVSNRLLSMNDSSDPKKVKCIITTDPSGNNINISNNLNCKGDECSQSKTIKKIAEVGDCDINIINDKEIWTFI